MAFGSDRIRSLLGSSRLNNGVFGTHDPDKRKRVVLSFSIWLLLPCAYTGSAPVGVAAGLDTLDLRLAPKIGVGMPGRGVLLGLSRKECKCFRLLDAESVTRRTLAACGQV
jgi:hypothetical protein